MKLNELPATRNRLKKAKRLGCGRGSGHGDTASRGNKGGNARSGYSTPTSFSGIPWYRKFPKRGFNNKRFKQVYNVIPLSLLSARLPEDFSGVVDKTALIQLNLIHCADLPVKLLGNGEWKRPLSFQLDKITAGAKEKIEVAGGKIITK